MKSPHSLMPLLVLSFGALESGVAAPAYDDPKTQLYDLTARASEIDPNAREHPEIGFEFADDKGKARDLQHAAVDTRVEPQGKLVIWLMGHNEPLFDRLNSYGLHAIQVSYANKWFGALCRPQPKTRLARGNVRLEAATGQPPPAEVADLVGTILGCELEPGRPAPPDPLPPTMELSLPWRRALRYATLTAERRSSRHPDASPIGLAARLGLLLRTVLTS